MSLVPYTVTALQRDVADAALTGKQVIASAVITMTTNPDGVAAVMYDDAAGNGGATSKTTSANGFTVVWVEAGAYTLSVNGTTSQVNIGKKEVTTSQLIGQSNNYQVGDTVTTLGYTTAGDGGAAQWVKTATTGTISQSPAQLGNAILNDANGNQWTLVSLSNESQLGGFSANTIVNNNLVFQAFFNAMPDTGGTYSIVGGDYTLTLGTSFTVSNKAITLKLINSLLPDNLPVVVKKSGLYSLPESSFQANRNVRVHEFLDASNSTASTSSRQYVSHTTGFLPESGDTTEVEFRGISYDIGTNALDLDVEVRGIKGRVYADGGGSNVRGMYSFVEAFIGSGFTGLLTGFLSTIYKNGNATGETVGIRSHVDQGCTAAYQAAGAGVTPTDTVSFGYSCRTGTGQPLLPTVACFQAHGGGSGDMFLGYKSNTDVSLTTAPYRVKNDGTTKTVSTYTNQITIADDGVTIIIAPFQSGMIEVFAQNAGGFFGKCYFRVAGSPLALEAYAGSLTSFTTGALTGTTGVDGETTISADGAGNIYIENRTGADREYVWAFVGKTV